MTLDKKNPGAGDAGVFGNSSEHGGYTSENSLSAIDLQVGRLTHLHPLGVSLARTIAAMAYGEGGA